MESNNLLSEKTSLLFQLQNRCEKFDYALENSEDFKTARIIYREIKDLREKLNDMRVSTTDKLENII
jgi:hypothetical protein